jgi:hypothetical protein
MNQLKKEEPKDFELPYAPLNEEDLQHQLEEEDLFQEEIKEVNPTEEDTKDHVSDQLNFYDMNDENENDEDEVEELAEKEDSPIDTELDEIHSDEDDEDEMDDIVEDEGLNNPVLYVDVNLGGSLMKRIVLYEADNPDEKAEQFA